MDRPSPPPRYVVRRALVEYDDSHDLAIDALVQSANADMRGQPAHMVYELTSMTIRRRLPGVEIDDEPLRTAAAKISFGLLPA